MNETPPKLVLIPKEAASLLSVSMPTMYSLLHRQDDPIPSIQVGRKILIPLSQLEAWLDRQAGA